MNQDLKTFPLDDNNILLSWNRENDETNYHIVGMNNLFNNEVIANTKKNKYKLSLDKLKPYIRVFIQYIYQDQEIKKEVVLGKSNYLELKGLESTKQRIFIHCISSYDGYSLSFYSHKIYDKYYLYKKDEEGSHLILETEDFQISSPTFAPGEEYYVEAYSKIDNHYELKAKSDSYILKPEKIKKATSTKLSIIVPIYNGELFLSRTLDSLLFSTFKEKEIILVNDGSMDNTSEIMKWYEENYKGIFKCYYQKNKGLSYARNAGLEHVTGEYVAFMDSDDMVHPYMYEKLYNLAHENNLDVAISKILIRDGIEKKHYSLDVKKDPEKDNLFYSFGEMFEEYKNKTNDNIFFMTVWHKIIKTHIVKNHPFPKNNFYEDLAFTMTIYSYMNRFGFCKSAYYVWDRRFQKTIGTYSTTYNSNKNSVIQLYRYYVEAVFRAVKKGSSKRIKQLAYYSISELYKVLDGKCNLYKNSFSESYIKEIKRIEKKTNLLNNEYIKKDEALLSFVKTILNLN